MDLGISGRVALVGGATSGLGLASARRLAQEGCDLLIWARSSEGLERTAADLRNATGRRVETLSADAAAPAVARTVADAAITAYGHVDILVLNAGGPPPLDPLAASAEQL